MERIFRTPVVEQYFNAEAFLGFFRKILVEDGVSQRIENEFSIVQLNFLHYMRVVSDDDVCAGVYEFMREVLLRGIGL